MVPTGTFSTTFAPSRPVLFEPSPWRPRSALYSGLKRKCTSVLWRSLDSMMTSPPCPPSPPLGPPRGTNFSRRKARQPLPPSPAFTRMRASSMNSYATSLTLTNLPRRPRSRNSTTPVTLANSESSLAQPTLSPGLSRVPLWRTMIEPPGTSCPPKTFTPSRCALESRPFLELPKPFLCAILHLNQNVADLHFGEVLAMPDGLLVLLLALELEDQDLIAPAGADDGRLHR